VGPRAGLDVCRKSRLAPGFDPRTVQPVASRYTDYAISFHLPILAYTFFLMTITFYYTGCFTTLGHNSRSDFLGLCDEKFHINMCPILDGYGLMTVF